jgi:hypothetical protein
VQGLSRPGYEPGSFLTTHGLTSEQRYHLQRLRRHNRFLHGWGVVCGLWVAPRPEPRRAWEVLVCPGYAIGRCGEEIEVKAPAVVDVHDYLRCKPREPADNLSVAYIGIRYHEEETRPVPAMQKGCACEETVYEGSRIRDGYQIGVSWGAGTTDDVEDFDLCAKSLVPCPPRPSSTYVLLACISLPRCEHEPIRAEHIDNRACRQRL